MFSGVFLCLDIYKQGNTEGVTSMPFIGGFVMCVLALLYGYILDDHTVIQANLFGLAISITYLSFYIYYAQDKIEVWRKIGTGFAFLAVFFAYSKLEDPELIKDRFGLIFTVLMFYLIASPLFGLKDIIKNQSTEGMPFPMIASGTLVSVAWLLHSIILRNKYMLFQNTVALVLCLAQLSLFLIYPSKPKRKDTAKSEAKKEK